MKMLSIHRPLPSMEMATPASLRVSVNWRLVNWLPSSVLKIGGRIAPEPEGLCVEADIEGVGQLPGEHTAGSPVHDATRYRKPRWTGI